MERLFSTLQLTELGVFAGFKAFRAISSASLAAKVEGFPFSF